MATASFILPALPEGWAAEKDFKVVGSLSPAEKRNVEPVGPHFLAHARRVSLLKGEVIILLKWTILLMPSIEAS